MNEENIPEVPKVVELVADPVEQVPDVETVDESVEESTPEAEATVDPDEGINRNVKRRIDRLGKKLADREAELERLREQLNSSNQPASHPVQKTGEPDLSDFETIAEYTRAVVKWDRQVHEVQQAEQRVIDLYNNRAQVFAKMAPDFVEAVSELGNVPKPMSDFVIESEVGPAIAYHLANNPEEYDRIQRLSPTRQMVALGAIETALSTRVSAKTGTKKPTTPAPISRVSGTSAPIEASAGTSQSTSDWIRARNLEILKRKNKS